MPTETEIATEQSVDTEETAMDTDDIHFSTSDEVPSAGTPLSDTRYVKHFYITTMIFMFVF